MTTVRRGFDSCKLWHSGGYRYEVLIAVVLVWGGLLAPEAVDAHESGRAGVDELDMLVILDRSGSMVGPNWNGSVSGLGEVINHPFSAGAFVGLSFFPVDGAPDQCEPSHYNPPQHDWGPLPGHAATLQNALSTQSPGGATPTYPALFGSLLVATTRSDLNPNRVAIVVLVTDGPPTECNTNIAQIAALASSAFNYNGVRTYAVGLPGATTVDLNQIASAGATGRARMLMDASAMGSTVINIMLEAVGLMIHADGFETGDTAGWSSEVP